MVSGSIHAQANLLNSKKVAQIGKKTKQRSMSDNDIPIPYGYVDDRDVLWSKVVWEFVDFNQKINFPYYQKIKNIYFLSVTWAKNLLFVY